MGRLVQVSGWMPRPLGWILMVGGAAYVLAPFLTYLTDTQLAAGLLALPATVGEFWMIGYLLVRGVGAAAGSRTKIDLRPPVS